MWPVPPSKAGVLSTCGTLRRVSTLSCKAVSDRQIRSAVKAIVYVGERRWNLRLADGLDVRLPETGLEDSLALLARLRGMDLRVHDPVVPAAIVPYAIGCSEPLACAEAADALVLATAWPQYRELQIPDLARLMTGRVLIDPFRLLDGGEAAAAGFEYHALGMPALGPTMAGSRR